MASKRKTAAPVAEREIFTDELPPPKTAKIQTEDVFFAEAANQMKNLRTGRRKQPVASVSFESVAAFLAVLTPKRNVLIEAVKERGRFDSIEILAAALHRGRATVSRDVKALAEAGLLRVEKVILPEHGRRTEISPAASSMTVELTI